MLYIYNQIYPKVEVNPVPPRMVQKDASNRHSLMPSTNHNARYRPCQRLSGILADILDFLAEKMAKVMFVLPT